MAARANGPDDAGGLNSIQRHELQHKAAGSRRGRSLSGTVVAGPPEDLSCIDSVGVPLRCDPVGRQVQRPTWTSPFTCSVYVSSALIPQRAPFVCVSRNADVPHSNAASSSAVLRNRALARMASHECLTGTTRIRKNPLKSLTDKIRSKLPAGSLRRRFASGAFWSMIGVVASRGATLAASILVARIIGQTSYGELGMVLTTVTMFTTYASVRLGLTATKHVAEFRVKDPARAGRILGLSFLVALTTGGTVTVIAVIFGPYIAEHTINAPHLGTLIQLGALMLFFGALNGAQIGAMIGFESFKVLAKVKFFSGLISFPCLLCGAYFFGLTGIVYAHIIISASGWYITHLALRKEVRKWKIKITFRDVRADLPILWQFSLPAFLGGIIISSTIWLACAILSHQPDGYDELAIFNVARQWWGLFFIIPGLLSQVNIPILTERYAAVDRKAVRKVLLGSAALICLLTLPAVAIVSLLSKYVMTLYGTSFIAGRLTLLIMIWTAALVAGQQPIAQVIVASSRMWLSPLINIIWAAIMLVSFLFLRHLGALGLALAFLIGYVCSTGAMLLVANWLTQESTMRRSNRDRMHTAQEKDMQDIETV